MWIFKKLRRAFRKSNLTRFSRINSIKMYYFSTLHTTFPLDTFQSRLFQIINNCFLNNITRKYKFLVIGKQNTCFGGRHSDRPYIYSEAENVYAFDLVHVGFKLWSRLTEFYHRHSISYFFCIKANLLWICVEIWSLTLRYSKWKYQILQMYLRTCFLYSPCHTDKRILLNWKYMFHH
jgi:hypothetical protein